MSTPSLWLNIQKSLIETIKQSWWRTEKTLDHMCEWQDLRAKSGLPGQFMWPSYLVCSATGMCNAISRFQTTSWYQHEKTRNANGNPFDSFHCHGLSFRENFFVLSCWHNKAFVPENVAGFFLPFLCIKCTAFIFYLTLCQWWQLCNLACWLAIQLEPFLVSPVVIEHQVDRGLLFLAKHLHLQDYLNLTGTIPSHHKHSFFGQWW